MDATLLAAPVSKQNRRKERDLEMSSTRKNNKWHFRAKGHIGVQAQGPPIIHSTEFTTANVHNSQVLEALPHGEEQALFEDSGYSTQAAKRQAWQDSFYYGLSDRGGGAPASFILFAKETQSPACEYPGQSGTSLPDDQASVGTRKTAV